MELRLEVHVNLVVYRRNDRAHRNLCVAEELIHVLRGCELDQKVYYLTNLRNRIAQQQIRIVLLQIKLLRIESRL